MTIKQAITKGMIMLKSNNVESPKLKARLLLQYVLDKPRQYIIVYDNKEIDKQQQWQYFVNIEKLTKGIPLQHITHRQEFMKMDFFVDENVLIPRPDTEILVEEVIKIAQKYNSPRILDLCTGSGAIAISLKKFVPNADITAVDISEKALEIAQKNAEKLEAKINFVKSNLFDKLDNKKFDIIVSNPPYIPETEVVDPLVKDNEPNVALFGGNDGLKFFHIILENAPKIMKEKCILAFEHGYNKTQEIEAICKKYFPDANIYTKKDLQGLDRMTFVIRGFKDEK